MDHDARLKFMKDTVIPRMGALFTGFDGTRFAKVTCITCHGSSAKTGNFDMPNPELPKLSFTPGAQHHDPAMMKFMSEQVEVHMAQLLSEQPFDMQTKQGFGCLDCHTKAN